MYMNNLVSFSVPLYGFMSILYHDIIMTPYGGVNMSIFDMVISIVVEFSVMKNFKDYSHGGVECSFAASCEFDMLCV